MDNLKRFIEHGGLWVLAQIPILLAGIFVPSWTGRDPTWPSAPALIGTTLVAVSAALALAAFLTLGRDLTPFPHPRNGGRLRQQGIYRWMRHPIYSAMIAFALGWSVLHESAVGLAVAAGTALFFDRKARREEQMLLTRYPAYAQYRERVRRFVPGIY